MSQLENKKFRIDLEFVVRTLIILGALAMVLTPILFLISNSLKPNIEMYNNPRMFPSYIETAHYQKVLAPGSHTIQYVFNSLVVALCTTVVSVATGTLAAYALNKLGVSRAVALITLLIVVVRFYPKITVVIPYFLLMKTLGLLDSIFGIVVSHVGITIPIVVMMMQTFFAEVPKEMEEAAYVDGANTVRAFFRVVLPTVKSGMAASAILVAMTSWNEFLMASAIASKDSSTIPIVIAGFITDKGIDWGAMSAVSVICIVPIMIFVLVFQKYLVKGLTSGAVKG